MYNGDLVTSSHDFVNINIHVNLTKNIYDEDLFSFCIVFLFVVVVTCLKNCCNSKDLLSIKYSLLNT